MMDGTVVSFIVPVRFCVPLTHSLTQVIRKFAKQLDEWLKIALHDLPENLRNIKFECKYSKMLHIGNPPHPPPTRGSVITVCAFCFQCPEDFLRFLKGKHP